MKPTKLSKEEAGAYWRETHSRAISDLQAVCFPDRSQRLNLFFHRAQAFALRRALQSLGIGGQDEEVLEVGCGRGRWLRFFQDRGASPQGVDLSHEAVARCVEQGLAVVVGRAEDLPFPSESFDLVVSITVLLHLPPDSQRRAAAEMQRVCRPGGSVLILEGTRPDPSPHVWTRQVEGWASLFDRCRPTLVESHYFALPLRLLWRPLLFRSPAPIQRVLDEVAVTIAVPLEYALMQRTRGRIAPGALQSLIVLEKEARESVSVTGCAPAP